jgi:hypothetical protein
MGMNPADMMRLMGEFSRFQKAHPKVVAFFTQYIAGGLSEESVIEISVQKPGEEKVTCNMKVLPEDVQMAKTLKEMKS